MRVVNRESPRPIHLAQAIAKGDKMEWIIQKAVELGATSITPLLTERCVVRLDGSRLEKKQHQWQAIAIAACEQSGRNTVPTIYPCCTLDDYLTQCDAPIKLTLSPHTQDTWPLIQDASTAIALIIGPEGGLSAEEVQKTLQYQACAVRLGPRILRSETAAITALGLLQMRYGDL
jgi:16S rRNA (uracil1498-N3)-methyltransferase